ncbi:MAG: 30S ribosomal protein S12 methylthiotransferase RimO [Myxococcales bacterium]|nr:30S ribosomal protein S12 methylthiotransferase RimO [Myxococcales bacterium]|tara:strand:- start:1471 stop:2952 length:1482 start_codon:yes stop_codon:yes gene_type:complete
MTKRVHFVSLGCPKNRVDSEVMLGKLVSDGHELSDSPEDAHVIVVNTCGFIDAAKEESVQAILDAADQKENGRCEQLIVSGCLSQRYAPELEKDIPEVDHFLGTGNFMEIDEVVGKAKSTKKSHPRLPIVWSGEGQEDAKDWQRKPRKLGRNAIEPYHYGDPDGADGVYIPDPDFTISANMPRVSTLPSYSAYLKISEGCSNTCSFCIIPKLRGPQRSRPVRDVVLEFEALLERGAVEINLIAQDLCAYGRDLVPRQNLAQLLRALDKRAQEHPKPVWIRCLYAYPRGLTREVVEVLASAKCIVPYLDMPLQHISDGILRRMRRGRGGDGTRKVLYRLRDNIPDIHLRTTFITGLPGESEADFKELCEFVKEMDFAHMGVFAYSPEEDTPAAAMSMQVPKELAEERKDILMAIQKEISARRQAAMIGQQVDVLVEGISEESELLVQGRHAGQAPEIDGLTYITSGHLNPGDVVPVQIMESSEYDLAGECLLEP